MSYLPVLADDEIRFICAVIPHQHVVDYFKQSPREFSKIRPGFRAQAISKKDAENLLFMYHKRDFIATFIEKHIDRWLLEIQQHVSKCMGNGDNQETAFMNTLPYSFFADNVEVYFKLANEECSEEYITLLATAVKIIKLETEKLEKKDNINNDLSAENKTLKKQLISKNNELTNGKKQLDEKRKEIRGLREKLATLGELQTTVKNNENAIRLLQEENANYLDQIKQLTNQLAEVQCKLNEEAIKPAVEILDTGTEPVCPCNLEEFKEYLEYNFTNIGISDRSEYFSLFIAYLSNVLFQGIPIVINRRAGINLIKCLANTITGNSKAKVISYNKDLTFEQISTLITSEERILCLDNFLGNYNEMELIPLFEKHRNKILFLTVAYDRTLQYLSKEFFQYSQYMNVNRVGALSVDMKLTEDPSILEENNWIPQFICDENRFQKFLREILQELGYPRSMLVTKSKSIANEEELCSTLAFDVLPYCTDVLHISPYNISERLLKYAGKGGRCLYKNLLMEWFA